MCVGRANSEGSGREVSWRAKDGLSRGRRCKREQKNVIRGQGGSREGHGKEDGCGWTSLWVLLALGLALFKDFPP